MNIHSEAENNNYKRLKIMAAVQTAGINPANTISFSVITSHKPDVLSKQFHVEEGKLVKTPGGQMSEGEVSIKTVSSPEEFREMLTGLGRNQAISASLPTIDHARIVPKYKLMQLANRAGVIARTKKYFHLRAEKPGVLILDCDGEGYTLESLMGVLRGVSTAFATCPTVGWASASSFLFIDGEPVLGHGARGWRVWVFVEDAGDIPRAGAVLLKLLWLAGYGRIEISKAGSLLMRTVFDGSVWDAGRLDFAAGGVCGLGVEQRRGEPVILGGGDLLNTRIALPDLAKEQENEYSKLVAAAKAAKLSEADRIKAAHHAQRDPAIHARMVEVAPDATAEEAHEIVARAMKGELVGEFPIKLEDGRVFSVREILDEPSVFNQLQTYDPLEYDYQDGKITGILFLNGATPVLHSQAHGGTTYKLRRERSVVCVKVGDEYRTVKETADALRGRVWKMGGRVGVIAKGVFQLLTEAALNHEISGACRYVSKKPIMKAGVVVGWFDEAKNVPRDIAQKICQTPGGGLICEIESVRSAPVMNLDGVMSVQPGYDPVSGCFLDYDEDEWPGVPTQPDESQVQVAVRRLYAPISKFPYVSGDDRAVAIAAMLTSAFRIMLPSAPGVAADANVHGSGKSKLASCWGLVGAGEEGYRVVLFSVGMTDDAVRQQIATNVKAGSGAFCLDNVRGEFDSTSWAGFLTPQSANHTERGLHSQDFISGSHRMLSLVTGNNLSLRGELPRRFIVCRLDAGLENPATREFDFEPVDWVKRNRMQLLADCYTIYRGWLCADSPVMLKGTVGSFEQWSATIRQCTKWAGQFLDGVELGDPSAQLMANVVSDPAREEEHDLLENLVAEFGETTPFTAKMVVDHCTIRQALPLTQVLRELMPRAITVKGLGAALRYRRDRISKGLTLKKVDNRSGTGEWWVSRAQL